MTLRKSAAVLVIACLPACADGSSSDEIQVKALLRLSTVTIGQEDVDGNDPRLLSDPRAVLSPSPDTIVLVDVHPPFLRLFDGAGQPIASGGGRGRGPGEFQEPSAAAMHHGSLWVFDRRNARFSEWALTPFAEIRVHPRPPRGVLALLEGCGDRLAAVYGGGEPHEPRRGLQLRAADHWQDLSDVPPPRGVPFIPTYPDFRATAFSNSVVYHDWRDRQIKRLACEDGSVIDSVAVPAHPAHWDGPLRPQGIASIGDRVVMFYGRFGVRLDDTTRVAVWKPGTETVHQKIILGRWTLHDVSGSSVWIVDNRMVPTAHAIDSEAFLRTVGDL